MRITSRNNLKVQGIATQEVYISMEEAFQALKAGLGFEDSYNTFLCVREGKLMRGEDVSRHGSPMYEYTEVSNNPQMGESVPGVPVPGGLHETGRLSPVGSTPGT